MTRAVFVDRDGTINEDLPGRYVLRFEEFTLIDGAPEAIAKMCGGGFKVLVVSNQSAIGRGKLSPETHEKIMRYMDWRVREAGGEFAGVYVCPHLPEDGCRCRKPAPGLVEDALADNPDIDLSRSFLIGDSPSDMELASKTGLRSIYVLSGQGAHLKKELAERGVTPEVIVDSIREAAAYVLEH